MLFLTADMLKRAEKKAMENVSAAQLIENAAKACFKYVKAFDSVCVFCGKGNNGSDGYATAILLKKAGKKVDIIQVFEPESPECIEFARKAEEENIFISPPGMIPSGEFECIIDAIFGIGINGAVTGIAEQVISYINASDSYVVSADIPSGMNADTGKYEGACVRADKTVTFTAPKYGMMSNESVDVCGDISVENVGVMADYSLADPSVCVPLEKRLVKSLIPKRSRLSHKGVFGTVVMIAGCFGMAGAAAMAADAAYRSGCGLVKIIAPRSICPLLNIMVKEAVLIPLPEKDGKILSVLTDEVKKAVSSADSVLIGCGMGVNADAKLINDVLSHASSDVIIDADGINALVGHLDIVRNKNVILTPHPLEFSRISGIPVNEIEKDRIDVADNFAREYGVTLLLKGARSVIVYGGEHKYVSVKATSALAKAGSGDILSGVIASFCAQGISLTDSAAAACYIHTYAGMLAEREIGSYGVKADDILRMLPRAIREVTGGIV